DLTVYPMTRCEDEDARQWWEATWMEDISTVAGPDDATAAYAWTDQALDLTTFVDLPCGPTQTVNTNTAPNPDTHIAIPHQDQAFPSASSAAGEAQPGLLPLVPVEVLHRPPLQLRVSPPPAKRRRIDLSQADSQGALEQQPQLKAEQPLLPAPIASA